MSEHPPAPPDMGQALVARVVQALQNGPGWPRTALFLTYDEGGGFWDHLPTAVLEYDRPEDHAWVTPAMTTKFQNDGQPVGPAFRVPLIAVSPYIQQGTMFHSDPADHTSILRFLEWRFGLDPLVTIAPGRRSGLTDLVSMFDFSSTPDTSTRNLPATVDITAALTSCSETIPEWLPPLIGPVVQPFPQPAASVPEPGVGILAAGAVGAGLAAAAGVRRRARRQVTPAEGA